MSNPCFDTPSPPELCQRLCMSSTTSTPIPPDSYYDTNYTTIFSLDNNNQTQVNHNVHPVLSSDESYWPSTYSNSSGASPNSNAGGGTAGIGGGSGYYSPNHHSAATAAMKRSRSPNMMYHNLQLHHNGNHSNHIEHTGYYVPQYEKLGNPYEEAYYHNSNTTLTLVGSGTDNGPPVVRVVKRRNTANKKERRRTLSINSAFSYLRDRIPNVPSDTKLSKIKTLRLATSYIHYLTRVLEGEDTPGGFRAELVPSSRKINAERRANMHKNGLTDNLQMIINNATHGLGAAATASLGGLKNGIMVDGRKKGRTGWPQEVWRNALKSEPQ